MLTSPITTPHFQTSVINLISTYYKTVGASLNPEALPVPLVPALKPIDSTLVPSDSISQIVIATASWIDLASPDPVIANISQQVLNLEVAYAAFCGVQHVLVHGPTLGHGSSLTQFSKAIQEAISIGSYIQFHVLVSIGKPKARNAEDTECLAHFARAGRKSSKEVLSDWSTWDAWNTIRQFCNYSGRLSVGKWPCRTSHSTYNALSAFTIRKCQRSQALSYMLTERLSSRFDTAASTTTCPDALGIRASPSPLHTRIDFQLESSQAARSPQISSSFAIPLHATSKCPMDLSE
jgi:hypothetical protein